jgi:hypothetical protein
LFLFLLVWAGLGPTSYMALVDMVYLNAIPDG